MHVGHSCPLPENAPQLGVGRAGPLPEPGSAESVFGHLCAFATAEDPHGEWQVTSFDEAEMAEGRLCLLPTTPVEMAEGRYCLLPAPDSPECGEGRMCLLPEHTPKRPEWTTTELDDTEMVYGHMCLLPVPLPEASVTKFVEGH